MIPPWRIALEVARKEVQEHFRTKRLFIIGGVFLLTFLVAVWIGSIVVPNIAQNLSHEFRVPYFLAFYFGVGLIGGYRFTSVLGIVLSADAIVSEWKDRTLILLLSKPAGRLAVLTGKVIGAYASVLIVFTTIFTIGIIGSVIFIDMPNAAGWGRILAGMGIILLGLFPFVCLGIMTSCLFRTPATSFVVSMALWLLVFPILGNMGFFIALGQRGISPQELLALRRAWMPLDPLNLMGAATSVLTPSGDELLFDALSDLPIVFLAMALHSALYLGISYWMVARRDYA